MIDPKSLNGGGPDPDDDGDAKTAKRTSSATEPDKSISGGGPDPDDDGDS